MIVSTCLTGSTHDVSVKSSRTTVSHCTSVELIAMRLISSGVRCPDTWQANASKSLRTCNAHSVGLPVPNKGSAHRRSRRHHTTPVFESRSGRNTVDARFAKLSHNSVRMMTSTNTVRVDPIDASSYASQDAHVHPVQAFQKPRPRNRDVQIEARSAQHQGPH